MGPIMHEPFVHICLIFNIHNFICELFHFKFIPLFHFVHFGMFTQIINTLKCDTLLFASCFYNKFRIKRKIKLKEKPLNWIEREKNLKVMHLTIPLLLLRVLLQYLFCCFERNIIHNKHSKGIFHVIASNLIMANFIVLSECNAHTHTRFEFIHKITENFANRIHHSLTLPLYYQVYQL